MWRLLAPSFAAVLAGLGCSGDGRTPPVGTDVLFTDAAYCDVARLPGLVDWSGGGEVKTLVRALPHPPAPGQKRYRIAVLHAGAPAAGMNTAARSAIRLGLDAGHIMLGVSDGFEGLAEGKVREMDWTSVSGWASLGGSEMGTSRMVPQGRNMHAIARAIEDHRIEERPGTEAVAVPDFAVHIARTAEQHAAR